MTTIHISDERSDKGGTVLYLIDADGETTRTEVATDTLEHYLSSMVKTYGATIV